MNSMLYDFTSEIQGARRKTHREILRLLACMAVPLILTVILFSMRMKWPCILTAILTCAVMIFLTDMKLRPALSYEKWLKEISGGRQHDTVGILTCIGEEDVYEDKLCFREVILNIYLDLAEEGERRFLLDSGKSISGELLGQPVRIRSHENYIVDIGKWKK